MQQIRAVGLQTHVEKSCRFKMNSINFARNMTAWPKEFASWSALYNQTFKYDTGFYQDS